jgi:hypothetical protein
LLKIIEQNILDIEQGTICHQVNCLGAMNSGIAKSIREKWPRVYSEYSSFVSAYSGFEKAEHMLLGRLQLVFVDRGITVADVFGQLRYGPGDKTYTEYGAVEFAFSELAIRRPPGPIYVPFRMGCDRAGGDWNTYKAIIETWIPDAIVCKLTVAGEI